MNVTSNKILGDDRFSAIKLGSIMVRVLDYNIIDPFVMAETIGTFVHCMGKPIAMSPARF